MDKKLVIKTLAGVELMLMPVEMTTMPSKTPSQRLRFQGEHIPGTTLDDDTQNAIQAFMLENGTEALWDGRRNVTLAGGMLANCDPKAVLQVDR